MIRNITSKSKATSRVVRARSHAVAVLVALTYLVPTATAYGQAGFLTRDPNVTVDMGVLEELGPPATVAGQFLATRRDVRPQLSFPPPAAPVSRLTGPLAAKRFRLDEPARRQLSPPPRTTAQPPPAVAPSSAPTAAAPTVRQPVAPRPVTPAPAQVAVPSARPSAPPAPTPVPPAPEPPPARTVAAPPPAPAPAAAPTEKVDVAPPPPPPTTTAAAPPASPPPEEPAPPPPAAPARQSTPPLTPSPAGPAPAPPAPAPEQAAAPPPVQTASTGDAGSQDPSFRILFDGGSQKISDAARGPLEELSQRLKEDENLRVQLLAYAGGTSDTAAQARRLSLSRALAVRSFLINEGVRSTRMDVRALGNKAESGPADRVDAVIVER